MIYITVSVDAPAGAAQAIKEELAMYLERFGNSTVLRIVEDKPRQLSIQGLGPGK